MPVRQQTSSAPLQFGGLNTTIPASMSYPFSPDCLNVRWGRFGELLKRAGFTTYNATAMPATTRAITGVFQFNRRDASTRYTIVGTQDKIFSVPTTGAWTTLVSGLTAAATDYYDAAVFNNNLILCNGVDAPQITDGTAANTGALVAKTWQTMAVMTTAQTTAYGLQGDGEGFFATLAGSSTANTYDGTNQGYNTVGDAWRTLSRCNVKRDGGGGFQAFGRTESPGRWYAASGSITSTTGTATVESYDRGSDFFRAVTNITTARRQFEGIQMDNAGFCIAGNADFGASAYSAVNERYDPATDTWSTKTAIPTAVRGPAAFAVSNLGFITSGRASAGPDSIVTTHRSYNPFSDAWTSLAAVTNGRLWAGGISGSLDRLGYIVGGGDSGGANTATVQSYNLATDAWTQENAVTTAAQVRLGGHDSYWVYSAGGTGPISENQRLNVSPAAPVARYVEAYRGYLFLARTSSFPSRVWYSRVGDARNWHPDAWIDVNPDDGDWITSMFVLDGRLYVTKVDTVYQIVGTVFNPDPEIGQQDIVPLENVKGALSPRSVVVTDHGVFYLAKDGFRLFDGARSDQIGLEIQTTLDGAVASRLNVVCGLWLRSRDEIWWSFTNTGSTHNQVLVYNTRYRKWTLFSGISAESMAVVEDANSVDQLLFGTGTASDGRLFKAETGNTDNGAAINGYYLTGWFAVEATQTSAERYLYLATRRSGNWNLTVDMYTNFDASTQALDAGGSALTHTINLLSGSYTDGADAYFQDATDQLAVVPLSSSGHHHAIKFSNANGGEPWEVYAAIMKGHAIRPAGQWL